MAFIMTIDQQVDVAVQYVDAQGNPAPVDGVPVWDTSDSSIFSVQAATDGMSATVVSMGIGSGQLSVTGDADLGSGVQQVIATLDMSIVGGMAVAATITPGTPTDKPVVNPLAP